MDGCMYLMYVVQYVYRSKNGWVYVRVVSACGGEEMNEWWVLSLSIKSNTVALPTPESDSRVDLFLFHKNVSTKRGEIEKKMKRCSVFMGQKPNVKKKREKNQP